MLLCQQRSVWSRLWFSSGHVWMWDLNWEENWVPKNWCFWTMVLEKTLESPLDCKEIQPVHSKGDQSWVFIGRTDARAETTILWPSHGLQHSRLHCPSPSPWVCPNSCPLSRWCHPTISSSVALFSCSQSFPASGSFPVSQLFTSGGQSIGP